MVLDTTYQSRKDQIVGIAGRLFKINGYPSTSMRQLAAEVGIEPASIYSHIKSKEALLKEICFSLANKFLDTLRQQINEDLPAGDKLRKAIELHISVITSNIDSSAVFFHDWRHLNLEDLEIFKRMRHEYEAIFNNIIIEGIKQNIFKSGNEKYISLTLFSAMNWTHEWYKLESGIPSAEVATHIADILIHGINYQQTKI